MAPLATGRRWALDMRECAVLSKLTIGQKVLLLVGVAELILIGVGVNAWRAQRSLQASSESVAATVEVVRRACCRT
ncbi:MAG: hypothetical protein R2749_31165 [Acidimicrobiales bacterium]